MFKSLSVVVGMLLCYHKIDLYTLEWVQSRLCTPGVIFPEIISHSTKSLAKHSTLKLRFSFGRELKNIFPYCQYSFHYSVYLVINVIIRLVVWLIMTLVMEYQFRRIQNKGNFCIKLIRFKGNFDVF